MTASTQPPAPRPAADATGLALPQASEGRWTRTFSSLSNPHFRLLWLSMLFSFSAIQMMFIAQGYLTFRLTSTATSLGLIGLGWGVPQLLFTLIGGVAADRLHKRALIMFSQGTLAITSLLTAILIQTDLIALWQIFGLALVGGVVFAFNVPARQAWIPELVGQDQLMNAVALNSSAFTATGIVGPGLAGALIATPFIGLTGSYYVMAACFAIVVVMLARIPGGAPRDGAEREPPYQAMVNGLRYIRRHSVLPILLLMGFVPIVIGMPYRQFFPVFAEEVYGVGAVGLGLMGAVMSIGALVGSLIVASMSQTSKRSVAQLVLGVGFGLSLLLYAAMPMLSLGLLALLLVGFFGNGYWALNNTMVLGSTDRDYYGRVMSVYMLSWSIQPFFGLAESIVADAAGVQTMTAGVGLLLALALVLIAVALPGYGRLREEESPRLVGAE